MLDSVGNGASIELPDAIKGRAWQWWYGGRGGYRVVLLARDSHLGGWAVQGYSFGRTATLHESNRTWRARLGEYPESCILTKTVPYARRGADPESSASRLL